MKRKIENEQELIELLKQFEYEVHCLEDYSFQEQLNIMAATKFLVSNHGAGLTNMLFMPAGAKILELRHVSDNHNNCFFSLASGMEHDYYYLLNHSDSSNFYTADVSVDLREMKIVLELMHKTTTL